MKEWFIKLWENLRVAYLWLGIFCLVVSTKDAPPFFMMFVLALMFFIMAAIDFSKKRNKES